MVARVLPLLAALLFAVGVLAAVQLFDAPREASSGAPESTPTTTPTFTPTPTSNRPPPEVSIDLTVNGQQGPITVAPGTSVTYQWIATASVEPASRTIFVSIDDDTYNQLDGDCMFVGFGTCEMSAVVHLVTPGSVTNTVQAIASASPPGFPVCCTFDVDSVTVNVLSKDPGGDTDGDTIPNDSDPDDDNDGCTDVMEFGSNPAQGGQRNPHDFWDFYDTPDSANVRDKVVTVTGDIFQVARRFGANDAGGTALINRNSDPLAGPPPPFPAYHPAFDRGPLVGPNAWNLGQPDGTVTVVVDVLGVARQFGHSCTGLPPVPTSTPPPPPPTVTPTLT
jgi:hypothetical protein